jgi:type IV pilus assembly protein PilW
MGIIKMYPLDHKNHTREEKRREIFPFSFFTKQKEALGFSLVELLIALAVGLIVLAAIYGVFTLQNKKLKIQEQIAEMQQNARVAMDMMTREIRMAGYDPIGSAGAGIISAPANSVNFTMDLNADGDTTDSNENITYSLYTADGIQKLGRKSTATATNQPVAEHIQTLTFNYYDETGTVTATLANIRKIRITVTATTALPDPEYTANGGYRTITLTSQVTPRNLAY